MNGAFDPQAAWEALVAKGVSKEQASLHVLRQVQHQPAEIAAQYLKDIDPGWLAAFGLGAADMASFGLGKQAARALLGETATMTETQAASQHPTAHLAGEIAGVAGPAGVELGLAKLGRLVPTALGRAIEAIRQPVGRAAAKTALRTAIGAGYGAAQGGGRTEGSLTERGEAALEAAPYGAAAGAGLPIGLALLSQALRPVGKYAGGVLRRVAGKGQPAAGTRPAVPPMPGLLSVGEDIGTPTVQPGILRRPQPTQAPDPLDLPTFQRRGGAPVKPNTVIQAQLRQLGIRELNRAWLDPALPGALRKLLKAEYERRGVTLPPI